MYTYQLEKYDYEHSHVVFQDHQSIFLHQYGSI